LSPENLPVFGRAFLGENLSIKNDHSFLNQDLQAVTALGNRLNGFEPVLGFYPK